MSTERSHQLNARFTADEAELVQRALAIEVERAGYKITVSEFVRRLVLDRAEQIVAGKTDSRGVL